MSASISKSGSALPTLMVAPNGARLTGDDHPALPVTIPEIVATAKSCAVAGAGAIHFHVRDANRAHILDAGLYREALDELRREVPMMHHQITTETVGRYAPADMRRVTIASQPEGVSIGVVEMMPSGAPAPEDAKFYAWLAEAGIAVQHICYLPEHLGLLGRMLEYASLPKTNVWCLFVIGHYSGAMSHPDMIAPFKSAMDAAGITGDWAVCAFREEESACIASAVAMGGKLRVGFENSSFMADGTIAPDNAARVAEAATLLGLGHDS
jgi:3-keto-5-aminohexanoate cleavage enzyme